MTDHRRIGTLIEYSRFAMLHAGTIWGLSRILFEKKCKDQIQTEVIIANLESGEKQTDGKEFVFAIGIIIFRHSLEVTSRATLGMGGCPFGFFNIKRLLKMCLLFLSVRN